MYANAACRDVNIHGSSSSDDDDWKLLPNFSNCSLFPYLSRDVCNSLSKYKYGDENGTNIKILLFEKETRFFLTDCQDLWWSWRNHLNWFNSAKRQNFFAKNPLFWLLINFLLLFSGPIPVLKLCWPPPVLGRQNIHLLFVFQWHPVSKKYS